MTSNQYALRYGKNLGIHINFIKIASFLFAENEVQQNSDIYEHTKHYQPFSSLSPALADNSLFYLLFFLIS